MSKYGKPFAGNPFNFKGGIKKQFGQQNNLAGLGTVWNRTDQDGYQIKTYLHGNDYLPESAKVKVIPPFIQPEDGADFTYIIFTPAGDGAVYGWGDPFTAINEPLGTVLTNYATSYPSHAHAHRVLDESIPEITHNIYVQNAGRRYWKGTDESRGFPVTLSFYGNISGTTRRVFYKEQVIAGVEPYYLYNNIDAAALYNVEGQDYIYFCSNADVANADYRRGIHRVPVDVTEEEITATGSREVLKPAWPPEQSGSIIWTCFSPTEPKLALTSEAGVEVDLLTLTATYIPDTEEEKVVHYPLTTGSTSEGSEGTVPPLTNTLCCGNEIVTEWDASYYNFSTYDSWNGYSTSLQKIEYDRAGNLVVIKLRFEDEGHYLDRFDAVGVKQRVAGFDDNIGFCQQTSLIRFVGTHTATTSYEQHSVMKYIVNGDVVFEFRTKDIDYEHILTDTFSPALPSTVVTGCAGVCGGDAYAPPGSNTIRSETFSYSGTAQGYIFAAIEPSIRAMVYGKNYSVVSTQAVPDYAGGSPVSVVDNPAVSCIANIAGTETTLWEEDWTGSAGYTASYTGPHVDYPSTPPWSNWSSSMNAGRFVIPVNGTTSNTTFPGATQTLATPNSNLLVSNYYATNGKGVLWNNGLNLPEKLEMSDYSNLRTNGTIYLYISQ